MLSYIRVLSLQTLQTSWTREAGGDGATEGGGRARVSGIRVPRGGAEGMGEEMPAAFQAVPVPARPQPVSSRRDG